jgi:hypothetical protein
LKNRRLSRQIGGSVHELDLFVMNLPPEIKSSKDIPRDFDPSPIRLRSEIIAKICELYPECDFSNPAWGRLELPGCLIEFSLSRELVTILQLAKIVGSMRFNASSILTNLSPIEAGASTLAGSCERIE